MTTAELIVANADVVGFLAFVGGWGVAMLTGLFFIKGMQ